MKPLLLTFGLWLAIFTTGLAQEDGLILHWSFDEIYDNQFKEHISDQSPGINIGAETIDGVVGKALEFNGTSDYINVQNSDALPPSILQDLGEGTISLWFRVDSIPLVHGIAPILYYGDNSACIDMFDASNRGLIIEVGHSPVHNYSKRLYFTIFSNDCFLPSFCYDSWNGIEEGKWYHFAAVVGSNYNTGFLNGVEMDDRRYNFGTESMSQFFEDALSHEAMWFGKGYWDGETKYFKGGIDEVKIFNKALTKEEVQNLYQYGSATSIVEEEKDPVLIFPNPVNDNLNIDNAIGIEKINIYTVNAQIVFTSKIEGKHTNVNLKSLQKGIYFIDLIKNGIVLNTQKIVKL